MRVTVVCLTALAAACGAEDPFGTQALPAQARGQYEDAEWVSGARWFTPGRKAPVRRIVIHIAQGTFAGTSAWFQHPNPVVDGERREVSAHYFVHRDGRVSQFVREEDTAWHVTGENADSIGIEHEGWEAQPSGYTAALHSSSAALVASIMRRHALGPDPSKVVYPHLVFESAKKQGKTCPGPFFKVGQGPRYFDMVRSALSGTLVASSGSSGSVGSSSRSSSGATASPSQGAPQPSRVDQATDVARRLLGGISYASVAGTQDRAREASGTSGNSETGQGQESAAGAYVYGVDPAFGEGDNYVDIEALQGRDCHGSGAACLLPGKSEKDSCAWGRWTCREGTGQCERRSPCPSSAAGADTDELSRCGREVEGRACRVSGQRGRCAVGRLSCSAGWPSCEADHAEPELEVCNGLDDDCDGETDDVASGTCDGSSTPAGPEACNGIDDNGDGYVDEGADGGSCETGQGPGRLLCVAGQETCSAADVPGLADSDAGPPGGLCHMGAAREMANSWLLAALAVVFLAARRRSRVVGRRRQRRFRRPALTLRRLP